MAIPTEAEHWPRRGQHQPLQQPAGEDLPDLRIGEPLLGEELLIRLLAELTVQALRLRDLRDLRVDQPLRQLEPNLSANAISARWSSIALEQRSKSPMIVA